MSDLQRERDLRRRQYLADREKRQLELTERILKNREELYASIGDEVGRNKRRELELERRLFKETERMVEERDVDGTYIDTYIMPEAYDEDFQKKLSSVIIKPQDRLDKRKRHIRSDQEAWELNQVNSGVITSYPAYSNARSNVFDISRDLKSLLLSDGSYIDFELFESKDDEISFYNIGEKSEIIESQDVGLIQTVKNSLPVMKFREQIIESLEKHPVLIIVGETGSGKTTQIPQYLYEAGYSKNGTIVCTQPRRVAAMSVASRVAKEMKTKLGEKVGYVVRFEDCTTEDTRIKYMTDGILLREFLTEPDLKNYSCVLIDEAHERSLHTDILFALIKDVSRFRNSNDFKEHNSNNEGASNYLTNDHKPFRLIISSATLEAKKFSQYFDNAPIINIPGRRFPVKIYYTKSPEANFIDGTVLTVLQIHLSQIKRSEEKNSLKKIIPIGGDILCFLPGQQEIEETQILLESRLSNKDVDIPELIILPIYSSLPSDQQAKIFQTTPFGHRKVVLATNIAETALTVDNIGFVVDCGFCKQNSYNPKTGLESLITVPCSQAAANQRSGRAGRVRPGKCFRLYTKLSFQSEMEPSNVPEIQRCNLGNAVLIIKSLGIDDLLNFDFMDPPPPETLIKALELLYSLGALDDSGELTRIGRTMAELPLDPMHSKMVLSSEKYKVVNETTTIVSMLSIGNTVFIRPKDKAKQADGIRKAFNVPGGDLLTLLNVYNQWKNNDYSSYWCYDNFLQVKSLKRARDIKDQIDSLLCDKLNIEITSNPNEFDFIKKSIAAGFFSQSARMNKGGNYTTIKWRQNVDIHPSSTLFNLKPLAVIYIELVLTSKEYMRNLTEIKPEILLEVAPHYYNIGDIVSKK
ncbi:hypothetical protein FG386_002944 [Cryptosporidium ryanae]|uniref:uncharacterized protein n=1 Tax=Cryptosporidium ryanae TaxID=515981 RepID=UPI003519F430|nr:hypothetical protein FG386_002944 [Cryptosporidium ryanae]